MGLRAVLDRCEKSQPINMRSPKIFELPQNSMEQNGDMLKCHIEDLKILGVVVQNLDDLAT